MPRRPSHAAKRSQILRAATNVFSTREFHSVPVEDVAVAAGVGKGTLYLYFPTKERLLYATVLDALDGLLDELRAATDGRHGEDGLGAFVGTVLGFFWERRHLTVLMQRYEHLQLEPAGADWRARRARFVALARRVIEPVARASGLARTDHLLATEMLLAQIRAAVLHGRERDRPDRLTRLVVDLFVHGIGRRRTRRATPRAGRALRTGS